MPLNSHFVIIFEKINRSNNIGPEGDLKLGSIISPLNNLSKLSLNLR
jgi:hypothetical protein